jgi:predicted ATPase/DNA-binding winged helix-turn-helix (wHTH) protein
MRGLENMGTYDLQTSRGQEMTFGPFRFYPEQRLLLRAGARVSMGSRAREILVALVERAGTVVRKHELMARVWPDVIVEEGTLRVHIAALRKALGDGQDGMRYVENVTGHGYRFVAPLRRVEEPPPAPIEPAPADHSNNIPMLPTRMIGRAAVVARLASDLPQRRFVTIVGPGGIGKTTVAIAAADHLHASYPQGVRFVDLAAVADPLLVPGTVACALGLTSGSQDPLPNIIEFLRQRRMLIVLDNCEHIIEAAALLAERLRTDAPGVSVIATSRESLRAKGEWVLRLAPLELPPPGTVLSAAQALVFPAIELFTERARASLDTFELSDADAPAVADICRKLDGVPLAIELAAARVTLFGISGLASRLDDRLGLLTVGRRTAVARHQTLRAMLDWSHEILPRAQQVALRRLAVFAGLFDASSAAVLLVDGEIDTAEVPEVLAELAAKSLLSVQLAGEEVFYRLLDTTRAYALEKLEESLESAAIKRRHAQLCSIWAQDDLDGELRSLREWTAGNNQRVDDVRAALDWCGSPQGDSMLGVRLAATSAPIWFQSPFVNEYRGRLEGALRTAKIMGVSDAALELQLNAALGSATLYATGWSPSATAAFNRTLELAQRLGATVHHRRALWGLWLGRITAGDYLSALGFAEAFCLFASSSSDEGAMVAGDRMMALAHHFLGNQVSARHHAERALTWPARPVAPLSDSHFQIEHRIAVQAELARILWIQGFPDQAVRVGRESLERARSSGHSLALCYALTNVCGVLLRTGDLQEARRLIAMLLDHSSRHSLAYWHFWGRCLELALARKSGNMTVGQSTLHDPLCSPLHQESLATLDEGLATQEAFVRAEYGLAGWCAAELLRVKAEALLSERGANAAAAERVLRRSLEIAARQGALSWELRAATSLARLWHAQRRTPEARNLLASVHTRFMEGFESTDLVKARTLLEEMGAHKRRSSPSTALNRRRMHHLVE